MILNYSAGVVEEETIYQIADDKFFFLKFAYHWANVVLIAVKKNKHA